MDIRIGDRTFKVTSRSIYGNDLELHLEITPEDYCFECSGDGYVDDPVPCSRCRSYGCRTITCTKCNGLGINVNIRTKS